MAKNDFFPIVYAILSKLYDNLKECKKNDVKIFDNDYYEIKKGFFNYILKYLIDDKLVSGCSYKYYDNEIKFIGLDNTITTPKGIEYLQDNSMMSKVKMLLKDIKDCNPFV